VRLRQGDMREETVYSNDPASVARRWEREGAQLLHLVDLDGAIEGQPRNLPQIEAVLNSVSIPVQVAGGVRSLETVRNYFTRGVRRVVLGTAVIEHPELLVQASSEFPGSVWLGLDCRDGRVAIRGWTTVSELTVAALLPTLKSHLLGGLIYTDIARDGMLTGPNVDRLAEVADATTARVTASGGVSSLEDLRALAGAHPQVDAAIVGKALYAGRFTLGEALEAVRP
jgi:phosphoribosylformimino-5-aminoimidazole carboxamide ribotide isomerase